MGKAAPDLSACIGALLPLGFKAASVSRPWPLDLAPRPDRNKPLDRNDAPAAIGGFGLFDPLARGTCHAGPFTAQDGDMFSDPRYGLFRIGLRLTHIEVVLSRPGGAARRMALIAGPRHGLSPPAVRASAARGAARR